jgi:FAD/FMN-containing dehydrogenase
MCLGETLQPGSSPDDTRQWTIGSNKKRLCHGMIDKKPRLIARCADVADVMHSVNFARDNDLLVAIRCGGHNAGGLGICDDGLVIDLAGIKYTRVDPASRPVTVGGRCVWGDVDHATHMFGMATASWIISATGVGGLTFGGGIGHLTRKCGLSTDNLLSAEVVLANGKFVKANAEMVSPLHRRRAGRSGAQGKNHLVDEKLL